MTSERGPGNAPDLAEWKLRPPSIRPGIVARPALVDVLESQPVLLTSIAAALDRLDPIDPAVFRALGAPSVSALTTAVPRLLSAVSAMTGPAALVLDHVELLENQACLDAVAELALALPAGSRIVLAARRTPPLPVALLRARGRVAEVGVAELAMDRREARALLEAAGVAPSEAELGDLVERAEGWPVGLYLAALARKAGNPRHHAGFGFTGDDRYMADYLRSELLAHLSPELVEFLTRTAVLERMCGPLCDAVLAASGSSEILTLLEESNLLLVPLDRRREWYRYHQLFRELLLAELERSEPELVPRLQARAAAWCEANGLPEAAIDYAQAAGDADRVARLVAGRVFGTYASGRFDTVQGWLGWFEEQGIIERYPPVAVLGACIQALVGRPAGAERWANAAGAAGAAAPAAEGAHRPADGSTMVAHLAMMRGILCRDGVARMRADARAARAGLSPASPWLTAVMVIEGAAEVVEGRLDRGDAILAQAVEVGTDAGALPGVSTALAERSLMAIERGDWRAAGSLADRALGVLTAGRLEDYIMSSLVHAVAARTALHRGDLAGAGNHLARAARLRPLLSYAVPWGAVQTLLQLGQAYLALDDLAGARAVLGQARDIPLLATHLSFTEIGQRLYLSKHTVKTQAISIYRKLGASSRSEAVQRVQEVGLLAG